MSRSIVGILSLTGTLAILVMPVPANAQPPGKTQKPILDGDGRPLPAAALMRLGTARFRHKDAISFLGFTGEKHKLLAGSVDGEVRLWDVAAGKELRRLQTLPRDKLEKQLIFGTNIPRIVLSADGKMMAWHGEQEVIVQETATGKEIRRFKWGQFTQDAKITQPNGVNLFLSADGQLLLVSEAIIYQGNKFGIWKTATGALVNAFAGGPMSAVQEVTLADDGNTLATLELDNNKGNQSSSIRIWDLAKGKVIRTIDLKQAINPHKIKFLPGGKSLAVLGNNSNRVQLFETSTGKEVRPFPASGPLSDMLVSADGKRLFGIGQNQIHVWDVASGKELRQLPRTAADRDSGGATALSPDGKTLAVAAGITFRLWDVDSGKEVKTTPGHIDGIASMAFSKKGNQLLTGAPHSPVYIWELKSGRLLREFPFAFEQDEDGPDPIFGTFPGQTNSVQVGFAPDGKTVAGLVRGKVLHRWDAATGKLLKWPGDQSNRLTSFAFSPKGKHLALGGALGLRLVHTTTGKVIRTFDGTAPPIYPEGPGPQEMKFITAAFSPDGRLLLSTILDLDNRGGIGRMNLAFRCYEVLTGQTRVRTGSKFNLAVERPDQELVRIGQLIDMMVVGYAVAPDGRRLAAAGFASVKLWDLTQGKEVRIFSCQGVRAMTTVFSPDGKWLLAGRNDGGIRVWEAATGTVLCDLPAHEMAVTALAFAPDGRTLASGSADTTVLLWDWAELRKQVTAPPPLQSAKLETLWTKLVANDGEQVREALAALVATPGPTVAFLKGKLKRVTAPMAGHIEKLVGDLDSKSFVTRQKAMTELEQLGDLAAEALTKRLTGKMSLELQRRIEVLRDKIESAQMPGPMVQALRAVEVLERIGTPEARQLLEVLAGGAEGHRLTVEASQSLRRLKKITP